MITNRILWALLSAAAAAIAGVATRKLVDVAWQGTTGRELPPEDDDRSISLPAAAAWAAGVGAAAGVARVMSRRGAAKAWEKTTGDPPPGKTEKL
jgi:Protein of unknown function (DUF4235)